MNFAKFLRTPFLTKHLRSLLLVFLINETLFQADGGVEFVIVAWLVGRESKFSDLGSGNKTLTLTVFLLPGFFQKLQRYFFWFM